MVDQIYKVIDADNMKEIETFAKDKLDIVLNKYLNDGRWGSVSVDHDGDIILFHQPDDE